MFYIRGICIHMKSSNIRFDNDYDDSYFITYVSDGSYRCTFIIAAALFPVIYKDPIGNAFFYISGTAMHDIWAASNKQLGEVLQKSFSNTVG